MPTYVLSLGANQIEPLGAIAAAREKLTAHEQISIVTASRLWLSEPWGPVKQSWFVNQILLIESSLQPLELLQVTQQIEADLGRKRDKNWGPRVIDIDLIWSSDGPFTTKELVIPHEFAHERLFVLAPWLEIEPDARLGTHGSVAELVTRQSALICVPYDNRVLTA